MTATSDTESDARRVLIWFAVPQLGREQLLMMVVNNQEQGGLTHRPMMFLTTEQAERMRPMAEAAADELGVTAVLREYHCVSLLDRIEARS